MFQPDDTELEDTEHEESDEVEREAALLDAFYGLLSLYLVLWALHWSAKGNPSYGDHLLWERATKTVRKDVDRYAELVATFYEAVVLDPTHTLEDVAPMTEYRSDEEPAVRAAFALEAVHELVVAAHDSADLYDDPLAIQNVLAGIADHLSELRYLVKQRLGGHLAAQTVLSRMR